VALARAIIRRPKVILLDEPLSNIDALLRLNMRVELKRLAREIGQTIIFTTHDQAEAMAMAQRISILHQGQVHQVGTPEELYKTPSDIVVGKMVGSPPMNLIKCQYEEKGGKASLSGLFKIEVTKYVEALSKASSKELMVGVRPEDLKLSNKPVSRHAAPVKVFSYEPLGAKTLVKVLAKDGELLDVIGEPWEKYELNKEVWLNLNVEKIYIFDRTGFVLV
jgi:ABC-type sugar transport system ATPase subunit